MFSSHVTEVSSEGENNQKHTMKLDPTGILSSGLNLRRHDDTTHHRGVESAHAGHTARCALSHRPADTNNCYYLGGAGGPLDIGQTFPPSRRRHQPEEGQGCSHKQILAEKQKSHSTDKAIETSLVVSRLSEWERERGKVKPIFNVGASLSRSRSRFKMRN